MYRYTAACEYTPIGHGLFAMLHVQYGSKTK